MRTPVGEVTELITIDKRHDHPDRGQTPPPLEQTNSRFVLDSGGHSSRSIGESLARWWLAFAVAWSSHAVRLAA